MPSVSATRFKNNFFQYLDKIKQGESFNIILVLAWSTINKSYGRRPKTTLS